MSSFGLLSYILAKMNVFQEVVRSGNLEAIQTFHDVLSRLRSGEEKEEHAVDHIHSICSQTGQSILHLVDYRQSNVSQVLSFLIELVKLANNPILSLLRVTSNSLVYLSVFCNLIIIIVMNNTYNKQQGADLNVKDGSGDTPLHVLYQSLCYNVTPEKAEALSLLLSTYIRPSLY